MPTYVYDRETGRMVDKRTREPMVDHDAEWQPVAPMTFGDLPGYRSPIDGRWIEGRRARKYDLESNNCIDANDLPTLGGKIKNKRFAEKRGLKVTEE